MSTPPLVAATRAELAAALGGTRARGGRVGLVPTMGALHDGHAAIMTQARATLDAADLLVVSIFVNPLQFGPAEDLDRYPRTLEEDLRRCAAAGVDIVFAPSTEVVYPGGEPEVTVDPGPLGSTLEGSARPGHFRGVLTVVAKLFGLVAPDVAVFGEKDYQQLVLIRRMVADLCMAVDVVGVATVREDDGLALSSRNRYLSVAERADAVALSRALHAAADAATAGPAAALAAAHAVLDGAAGLDLDYLALTAPDLGPAPQAGEGRVLVAACVGGTRLIDNLPLTLGVT